jgi:hypothetical protein
MDVGTWELGLFSIAAYVAVVSLVRLMLAHRDRLARELDTQLAAKRRRQDRETADRRAT